MTVAKKILTYAVTVALAAGAAGATVSPAYAVGATNFGVSESSAENVEKAILDIHEATANGFSAEIKNGTAVLEEDGSVKLYDLEGEVAALSSNIQLNDGTSRVVAYTVSGNKIMAQYDSPIEEDAVKLQSPFRDSVECAISAVGAAGAFIGGVGAALTAPFTLGGGLVVAGAGITAGAAGANAAYQCYGKK